MKNTLKALAVAAGILTAACASRTGAGNDTSTEGQTLGGYVATGAVDAKNAEGTRTGDDDQTASGTEEQKPPEQKPPAW